ncbi:MAG: hypothetical protein KAU46_10335 [Candidatus Aminicenantes bacterium]|nr:hypothetical protein [Candidatus Aminicenantes bacterium]
MNKTKTEDLIKFDVSKEEISFDVAFYGRGAMLISKVIRAKTRLELEKKIRSYIETTWPANQDKISYKIR